MMKTLYWIIGSLFFFNCQCQIINYGYIADEKKIGVCHPIFFYFYFTVDEANAIDPNRVTHQGNRKKRIRLTQRRITAESTHRWSCVESFFVLPSSLSFFFDLVFDCSIVDASMFVWAGTFIKWFMQICTTLYKRHHCRVLKLGQWIVSYSCDGRSYLETVGRLVQVKLYNSRMQLSPFLFFFLHLLGRRSSWLSSETKGGGAQLTVARETVHQMRESHANWGDLDVWSVTL